MSLNRLAPVGQLTMRMQPSDIGQWPRPRVFVVNELLVFMH